MKKRIVLDSPIEASFDRVEIKQATTMAAHGCQPTPRCQLDRPPDGDVLLEAFNHRIVPKPNGKPLNHPKRILVGEDGAAVGQIYSAVLGHSGFQVDLAEDGEAGWNLLHHASLDPNGYDLLITDNNMPKLSGVELIQKLHSAHIEVPVILASGALPANTDWLHVAAVLPKPFPLDLLIQTVKEVLRDVKNE